MKRKDHFYRVVDDNNGYDLLIRAKSVAHAASLARKQIAEHRRVVQLDFIPWRTDHQTGGWHGVSIDVRGCNVIHLRPTPKPERTTLPWKQDAA